MSERTAVYCLSFTDLNSVDDDDKLREKVDEALTVYDEYVRNAAEGANSGVSDAKAIDGKAEEATTNTEAEPVST